jgi:hypothetical protein
MRRLLGGGVSEPVRCFFHRLRNWFGSDTFSGRDPRNKEETSRAPVASRGRPTPSSIAGIATAARVLAATGMLALPSSSCASCATSPTGWTATDRTREPRGKDTLSGEPKTTLTFQDRGESPWAFSSPAPRMSFS